jgi:hypothetical protein
MNPRTMPPQAGLKAADAWKIKDLAAFSAIEAGVAV